ncbi:N-acetyl sugar amidotransferase [Aquimarina sp. Aq78]|uniref:N-acetyl sugar amidotransferase n=1 Tax=Aquimarina sp. Aq78 TaxID=1191889 RepID=UPI000D0F4749|nr:N-acetyl sugar amidotransferase [Aquimarina sp. Aq78]
MIKFEPNIEKTTLKICSRCIYDERVNGISFDQNGVCNYCKQIDSLKLQYSTGESKGKNDLDAIVEEIKKSGKGKKYDCVVGVSGGTDSSYMLYLTKKWGLRPLAVHYDNTWNSAIATENIRKVLTALDIDLYTHVTDNKEADDIFKAFFKAGVAEIEASTDLALAETMYRAAAKYRVKYIFEGHSFVTEGITPVGRNYFDGKYIKSIHKKYGTMPIKTYPLMTFSRFLYWTIFKRIKKIRPFWYLDYNKEEARAFLEKEYDWKYYGGHHLENRMTAFYHSFYMPRKFNTDFRNNTLSARVRLGKLTREEAWKEYNTEPHLEDDLLEYFKKRLALTDKEFEDIMNAPTKSWYEFPTYKKRFERLRPLFLALAKANLVPMSFYLKYCFPAKLNK